MAKKIIDVCCGGKMFWFDKNNPLVEFCDKREVEKHEFYKGRTFEVSPDTVCDFTNLPHEDESFYLCVFDPPHLKQAGDNSWLKLKYGRLNGDWKAMSSKGFSECMRVLKPNGVLIFKWSEVQIPLSEILPLCEAEPMFGHRSGKASNTHWVCFMKGGDD